MKLYYTFAQRFLHGDDRSLEDFFLSNKIKFKLSADFAGDLTNNHAYSIYTATEIVKIYTVLIEEHELSAIMLSVGGIIQVDNKRPYNLKNKLRKILAAIWKR